MVDNVEAHRYEIAMGDAVAFLEYRRRSRSIALIHTEVPEPLQGKGLGSLLATAAFEDARANDRLVIVICPYVTAYLTRHPEYQSFARVASEAR